MRQIKRWYPNKSTKWRVNILKHLNIPVIMIYGLLLTLKLVAKWIKCHGLISNIINALNIELHLMTLNMMNTSINAC